MQKAYDEIKNILATRTINDDDLQELKEKYGEENLRKALIECLPEDIGLKLFMDKTMFDGMYEGGATRVAYETLKRIQSDPANAGSVYEGVLNNLDEENKKRYAESEPIVLTGGVISGCKQSLNEEKKPSFKKFLVAGAGAVLTLTAICSIALVACNNKEKDQGGVNTDPPIVSAQTTAGEIFDNVVDKNELMNFASNRATDKVKEAFAGAESVDFISSTQDGKSFALVTKGGETTLYAIVSDLTEGDRAILNENAESQVWETVEMNRDTAVKESEEKAVTQKITDAVAQYKAMVSEIIENATLTKTDYTQIDDSLVANDLVAKALGNFEAVFFGPMTESMKYTGDEQLSTENCTMSYAFGLNKDGTLSTFVVTYPDNGETSQEKLDAIASGSALISSAGTIFPGKTFEFPPLEQEEKTISAEKLYNQVFGKDYKFISFNDMLPTMLEATTQNYFSNEKLLFVDVNGNIILYFDAINSINRQVFGKSTYKGNNKTQLLNYVALSEQIESVGKFYQYVVNQVGENISIEKEEVVIANLQALKSEIENYKKVVNELTISDFTVTNIISNTTTSIDSSKVAEKFMPEGVEPIACYPGEVGASVPGKKVGDYPYFTTINKILCYVDAQGQVVIQNFQYIIGANSGSESNELIYERLLNGKINIDFVINSYEEKMISDPILTGNTSGITAQEEEAELSK